MVGKLACGGLSAAESLVDVGEEMGSGATVFQRTFWVTL